jgi:hypothetical protein
MKAKNGMSRGFGRIKNTKNTALVMEFIIIKWIRG